MTYIVGVIGAALLFGLFAVLRPRDASCDGQCIGCARDGPCAAKQVNVPNEDTRSAE